MASLLGWFHRHKLLGWIVFLIYAPLVTFPHDTVQYYVNEIAIRYTHAGLYRGAAYGGVAIAALITLGFALAVRRQADKLIHSLFWLLTITLIVGTWWSFMANNTELVHFPQYFPEGIMLLGLTGSAVESVAWATFFGGLDEAFQYTFLVSDKPVPFDFNDIFMDLLGAAAGVVFALAFLKLARRPAGEPWIGSMLRRPGVWLIVGIVLMGVLLWASGVMVLYEAPGTAPHLFAMSRQTKMPFWFTVDFLGPRKFHEMTPLEGPIVVLCGIALYALLDRRYRISFTDRAPSASMSSAQ